MKKILILVIMIFLFSTISADVPKFYELNIYYSEGDFSLNNLSIQLDNSFENIPGDYTGEIISEEGSLLDMFIFEIPSFIIAENINGGGNVIFYNESSFTIYAPYYENAREIIIYDSEYIEILKIEVNQFSTVLNNQINSIGENNNQNTSSNYESQNQENSEKSIEDYWWALLIVLIILVAVLIKKK